MTKRRRLAAGLVILCAAVLLLLAFYPRSFFRAMGVPRGQITRVEVVLDPVDNEEQGYHHLVLTPEDPGFDDLLDLLDSRRYLPMLPRHRVRQLLLEESVWMHVFYEKGGEEYVSSGVYLTGDRPIQVGRRDYNVSDSQAFQQGVLDLLRDQELEYWPNA